jgi:hypothetical protein
MVITCIFRLLRLSIVRLNGEVYSFSSLKPELRMNTFFGFKLVNNISCCPHGVVFQRRGHGNQVLVIEQVAGDAGDSGDTIGLRADGSMAVNAFTSSGKTGPTIRSLAFTCGFSARLCDCAASSLLSKTCSLKFAPSAVKSPAPV